MPEQDGSKSLISSQDAQSQRVGRVDCFVGFRLFAAVCRSRPHNDTWNVPRQDESRGDGRSGWNNDVFSKRCRGGHGLLVLNQPFDVHLDRFVHPPLGLFSRCTGRDAPGQIRRVRRIIPFRTLDDDQEAMHVHWMSELTVAALELIVDPDWSRPAVVTQVWVEAVATARTLDYEGTPVRVIGPDHLAALALQAGGSKRRERAWQLLESGAIDRPRLRTLLAVHGIDVEIGDEP